MAGNTDTTIGTVQRPTTVAHGPRADFEGHGRSITSYRGENRLRVRYRLSDTTPARKTDSELSS